MCIPDHSDGGKKGCGHGSRWADESFCSTADEWIPWNGSLLWGERHLLFQGWGRTDKQRVVRPSHTLWGGRIHDTGFKTAAWTAPYDRAERERMSEPEKHFWQRHRSISAESVKKWISVWRHRKGLLQPDDPIESGSAWKVRLWSGNGWETGRIFKDSLLYGVHCIFQQKGNDGRAEGNRNGTALWNHWDAVSVYPCRHGTHRNCHWCS